MPPDNVNVDRDEEHRAADRMYVAQQPSVVDVAHDVLGPEAKARSACGGVVHRQNYAGDDLNAIRQKVRMPPKVYQ